jgi:hypothetical protein
MRLAYIISAYKNLSQVARLVRRIECEGNALFVHVDKKTNDDDYRAFANGLTDVPSLHLLERHVCHWGGFGHIRATLKGLDELLARRVPFDYVILLTGQDYPIKSSDFIGEFFEENRGMSFMGFGSLPTKWWSPRGGLDRVEYWHLRLYGNHFRSPLKRRFPAGLRPFGGGAYWCLSRECVEYVSDFVGNRPDVVQFFKHVDIPDEIFFQTVIMNSELRGTVVNDNLRYVDWTRGRRPAILETSDFERLRDSSKLFARKFDVRRDENVLDLIDRHLLGAREGSKKGAANARAS